METVPGTRLILSSCMADCFYRNHLFTQIRRRRYRTRILGNSQQPANRKTNAQYQVLPDQQPSLIFYGRLFKEGDLRFLLKSRWFGKLKRLKLAFIA